MNVPQPLGPTALARPAPFWIYLYSRANVWGSIAGLSGVGLLFAGVIGPYWLAIVAGLYAVGAIASVAMPRPQRIEFAVPSGFSVEQAQKMFEGMEAGLKAAAGTEAQSLLASLRERILQLLPKQDSNALSAEDRYNLRETVASYLPETLSNYLKLPALYRRYHPVRDGKSAETLLVEQLRLLDGQLGAMLERVFQAEAQDLLQQGMFLDDKFRQNDPMAAPAAGR